MECLESASAAEIDDAHIAEGDDASGVGGFEVAEELLHDRTEDAMRARDEPARVHQVARASLVDDHLGAGECLSDIADSTRVIEVDVRHHDGGQVVRAQPEGRECINDRRSRQCRARLDEAGAVRSDEVAGGDARVSAQQGVDLEDLVTEIGHSIHRTSLASLSTSGGDIRMDLRLDRIVGLPLLTGSHRCPWLQEDPCPDPSPIRPMPSP